MSDQFRLNQLLSSARSPRSMTLGMSFVFGSLVSLTGCAQAQVQGGGEMTNGYFLFNTLYFFALIYFGYYFLVIRPNVLKDKTQKSFLEGLKKGDDVVSTGGIYGKVVSVEGDAVIVEVDRNVKLRIKGVNLTSALPKEEKKGEGK